MAGSSAALRVGLIGGLVLGLAMVAQQITQAAELRVLGMLIVFTGLWVTGYIGARDAGDYRLGPSARAGAVGGLVAGLLISLAVIAVLILQSINGESVQRINEAVQQVYTPSQQQQLSEMGITMETLAQTTVVVQLVCCGAALPMAGLLLGALGGAFLPGIYRGRSNDRTS